MTPQHIALATGATGMLVALVSLLVWFLTEELDGPAWLRTAAGVAMIVGAAGLLGGAVYSAWAVAP